jgi:HEAT repeat protein
MRTKIVLPVLLLAALLLGAAFFFSGNRTGLENSAPPPASASRATAAAASDQPVEIPQSVKTAAPKPSPISQSPTDGATPADHEAMVNERIAELNQLASSNDPHSLDAIISDFSNHDPAIRMAAVSAAIDFGSRDAIPALQNALGWTDDIKEKLEIQRAIDFLQLPSVLARDSNK